MLRWTLLLALSGPALAAPPVDGTMAQRVPVSAGCHGEALTGVLPATPGLLGLPADDLNAQLGAWRTGERHAIEPDCMRRVA